VGRDARHRRSVTGVNPLSTQSGLGTRKKEKVFSYECFEEERRKQLNALLSGARRYMSVPLFSSLSNGVRPWHCECPIAASFGFFRPRRQVFLPESAGTSRGVITVLKRSEGGGPRWRHACSSPLVASACLRSLRREVARCLASGRPRSLCPGSHRFPPKGDYGHEAGLSYEQRAVKMFLRALGPAAVLDVLLLTPSVQYHGYRFIWPVGYSAARRFDSLRTPGAQSLWFCNICDGGLGGPRFVLTEEGSTIPSAVSLCPPALFASLRSQSKEPQFPSLIDTVRDVRPVLLAGGSYCDRGLRRPLPAAH
jgi:hypothetical protein